MTDQEIIDKAKEYIPMLPESGHDWYEVPVRVNEDGRFNADFHWASVIFKKVKKLYIDEFGFKKISYEWEVEKVNK